MERVEFLPPEPGEVPEIDRVAEIPHPREMLSLLGQEAAERQFLQGYTSGKLHHAFLLAGPEGTGKATSPIVPRAFCSRRLRAKTMPMHCLKRRRRKASRLLPAPRRPSLWRANRIPILLC